MTRVNNNKKKSDSMRKCKLFKSKKSKLVLMTSILMCSAASSAYAADIENSAIAKGTYNSGSYSSNTDTATVPLATPVRELTVVATVEADPTKDQGSGDSSFPDAGDKIVYNIAVSNTGNVTETAGLVVTPSTPTFNGVTGTGLMGAVTVIPNTNSDANPANLDPAHGAVMYRVTYTMSTADGLRAAEVTDGISFTASATTTEIPKFTSPAVTTDIDETVAQISIAKVGAIVTPELTNGTTAKADVGETIKYTYTVTNTGNVPLTGVIIEDTHQGTLLASNSDYLISSAMPKEVAITTEGPKAVSVLGAADAESIQTLQAGATATFEVILNVLQEDLDGQL